MRTGFASLTTLCKVEQSKRSVGAQISRALGKLIELRLGKIPLGQAEGGHSDVIILFIQSGGQIALVHVKFKKQQFPALAVSLDHICHQGLVVIDLQESFIVGLRWVPR